MLRLDGSLSGLLSYLSGLAEDTILQTRRGCYLFQRLGQEICNKLVPAYQFPAEVAPFEVTRVIFPLL